MGQQLDLRRYALLLWRWLWLIALGAVLAAGSAYVTSKRMAPVYSASTMLLISPSKAQLMDTLSYQPMADRLAATYSKMITRRPVLEVVRADLGLSISVEALARSISAQQLRNTQLLQLSVEDTNPERAAAIANEIPKVFIAQNAELQARRYVDSKASLQRQVDETQADIAELQAQLSAAQATTPRDATEIDRLTREIQAQQSSFVRLSASYEDLRLEEAKQLDTLLVTEEASPPVRPIRPKTLQNTFLAAIVGAMLALAAAFLSEYLDDVLKNPDDVKAALGLTTLGAVPVVSGPDAEKLAMLSGRHTAVTESFRVLRTNLQFAAVGRPLRTLQISSPSPSEGKSLISANLAIALAQSGKRVILIDCDLHRPRVHKLLLLPNATGLTSALIDAASDPLLALQDYPVAGLRIMTSGPLPPNPAEILGSERMRQLMARLGEDADILILDSPPVLAMSDSAILASQVDGLLLALDASGTRRDLARRAYASLQQVQARTLGVILNRVPRSRSGYYYYHYHEYYSKDEGRRSSLNGHRWPWQRPTPSPEPEQADLAAPTSPARADGR